MESQQHSRQTFLDFVEQTRLGADAKSTTAYALDSVLPILRDGHLPSAGTLSLWAATMLIAGKKPSTVRRYLAAIRTIHEQWSRNNTDGDASDIFSSLDSTLKDTVQAATEPARRNAALLPALLSRSNSAPEWPTVAIFLYLLYTPYASLADVANLTFSQFDSTTAVCPQVADIIATMSRANGRRYIFPLGQGKTRPAEISRRLTAELCDLLTARGMRFPEGFSRQSVTALWIAAAIAAGIPLAHIRATITGALPADYAPLALVTPAADDNTEKLRAEVISRVADSICSHRRSWFAMKLRRGTTHDEIRAAIDANPTLAAAVTIYSPMRTTVERNDHKRIIRQEPYLPDIIFFNTRQDYVRPLFAAIGHLAWCFRTTPTGPYATIPAAQMATFQRCIGTFTDDILQTVAPAPAAQLSAGRRVRITGGIMAGYEGTIVDIDQDHRLFTLTLGTATIATWTATVENIFIESKE